MKGTLHKSMNYGWMIQDERGFYPLYPYDKFTNSIERVEGKEVDFTLVCSWSSQEEKLIEVAIISDKIVDVPKSKAKEMEKQNIIDAYEISDLEIEKWAKEQSKIEPTGAEEFGRIQGAKWYREQLKKKQ